MKNIRHYYPEINGVLREIVRLKRKRGFTLDFQELGTYNEGKLSGGLAHGILLNHFKKKQLDWVGIVENTQVVDIKRWIQAVNALESGSFCLLCEFYNEDRWPAFNIKNPKLTEIQLNLTTILGE